MLICSYSLALCFWDPSANKNFRILSGLSFDTVTFMTVLFTDTLPLLVCIL